MIVKKHVVEDKRWTKEFLETIGTELMTALSKSLESGETQTIIQITQ